MNREITLQEKIFVHCFTEITPAYKLNNFMLKPQYCLLYNFPAILMKGHLDEKVADGFIAAASSYHEWCQSTGCPLVRVGLGLQ